MKALKVNSGASKTLNNKDSNSYNYKKRGLLSMAKKPNSLLETMTLEVPFIIKREDGGFVAECIDLNIVTQGDTLKEVRKNIREAILLHFKSAKQLGMLDNEIEKLGVIRKRDKLVVTHRELESTPIEIPTGTL